MTQDRFVVIDVQGFIIDNHFFPKEVCVSGVDSKITTFLIAPPIEYSELTNKDRITNKWLCNHLHGLCWNDGNITHEEFSQYLVVYLKKEQDIIVYVKGIEKVRWLRQLLGKKEQIQIVDLDEFNCPNIKTLYKNNTQIKVCNYHRSVYMKTCSRKSVIILRNFISLYLNKENIEIN